MTEQGTTTTEAKKRGVGFPQMPLGESVEAIVTIGRNGASHGHEAAAAYLGHSTANSGAFRSKLAALRDWGLLVRGERDRVMLSELAQQLVLEGPDHEGAKELLLQAFESCRVFGMLYNDSAKNTPLDLLRLRTVVVMRHGVASEQADKFVDSFVESVAYARLGKLDGDKVTLLPRDAVFHQNNGMVDGAEGAFAEITTATPHAVRGPSTQVISAVPPESVTPVALRQAWPIDGGEIEFVIRTPKPLPMSVYALMAKMAEVAAEMEKLLKTGAPAHFENVGGERAPASSAIHEPAEPGE